MFNIHIVIRLFSQNLDKIKPRIINVASHCGLQPLPGFGPYSASKAGVLAWTKALRFEHYHHGLTAVALVPGTYSYAQLQISYNI